MRRLLGLACCALPLVVAAPGPALGRGQPATPAARCAALIAVFDEVIVNRFDYQILMLEDYELADARAGRLQAEAECAAGQYGFGIAQIESALRRIGVVPPDTTQRPDRR